VAQYLSLSSNLPIHDLSYKLNKLVSDRQGKIPMKRVEKFFLKKFVLLGIFSGCDARGLRVVHSVHPARAMQPHSFQFTQTPKLPSLSA
jgi:hypothetical protein